MTWEVRRTLLDAVGTMSRSEGSQQVDLRSDLSRLDARPLYERPGFTVTCNYFAKKL